ncbi:MAG: hypothetical protein R6U17_01085, partial [Thermoplasmata archaeon]
MGVTYSKITAVLIGLTIVMSCVGAVDFSRRVDSNAKYVPTGEDLEDHFRNSVLIDDLDTSSCPELEGPDLNHDNEGSSQAIMDDPSLSGEETTITYTYDEYGGEGKGPFEVDLTGVSTDEGHPGFHVGEIHVSVSGAGGGGGFGYYGGNGGKVEATFDVSGFDDLALWVGEGGGYNSIDGGSGGWGYIHGGSGGSYGGGGGGSTEIWADYDPVVEEGIFLAAAGGGGGGGQTEGG